MTVRQEESTPIGDFFHDSGIKKIYELLEVQVDEFEVDTEVLTTYCDGLIEAAKGLKSHIKKVESSWSKMQAQRKVAALLHHGID